MKWLMVLGIVAVAILITLYEWPKIEKEQKREKKVFVVLTTGSVILGIVLVYFPDMPGPTQLVEAIFKPLGKLLEP
ncbi:hypothetical protein FH966_10130 [Lentibacillus cibarius]|uniref:Uncharacterized protein n=1 Tax=Lentibacillus cibarius TaxID=2583219 RepID=A0A549YJF3_9BACI|nr:hypothetical protein [Lentibacillus cibarius]TMN23231.1 hypothetical protein FFL34_14890 [Lentibacillus cibarius]TRM12013.1 hypothetical protein FH966_10130 [Lentibacillus cibarius]